MSTLRHAPPIALALLLAGRAAAEEVPITLLHVNDVYEIEPVQGGASGGLARLATLRRQLARRNPNTFLVTAGDLFSPSALGTALVDGTPLAGAQMVAALNAAGLAYATFGNHELDLPRDAFLARLRESRARWISGNVRDADGRPFPGVEDAIVFTARGAKGAQVRVGLLGVTVDANRQPWVTYRDPLRAAQEGARALRPKVDVLVALTHLTVEQDIQLAEAAPELDLVLGGHEHENFELRRGERLTPILKADANARTAFVVDLVYDTVKRRLRTRAELRPITAALAEDAATARVVRRWRDLGFAAFRAQGFEPTARVAVSPERLDGREASVRNRPTGLTDLVAEAALRAWPGADASLYNAGSIRIDDEVPPGPVTQYDVLRMMPFGGKLLGVALKGRLLSRALAAGVANRGKGGFLQGANLAAGAEEGDPGTVGGERIAPERTYRVVMTDFLLSGREHGLEFLTRDAPGVEGVTELADVRLAVISELQRRWPDGSTNAHR